MPPLDAQISSIEPGQLNAAVFFAEGASGENSPVPSDPPLLLMRLMQPGSVYIGVSRGLLRAANFPWQGNEDGDLIFEIERFGDLSLTRSQLVAGIARLQLMQWIPCNALQ